MLADDVEAARGSPPDLRLRGALSRVADRIRLAHRFTLSTESCAAAYQVAFENPWSVHKVLPLAKPAFQVMWVEWEPYKKHQGCPYRIGVLIEGAVNNGDTYTCTFVAGGLTAKESRSNPIGLRVLAYGLIVSLNNDILSAPIGCEHYVKDEAQYAALAALFKRVIHWPTEYMVDALGNNMGLGSKRNYLSVLENDSVSVHSFRTFVVAVLAMINVRNVVNVRTLDVEPKNKLRKMLRKPALMSFSEVTIDLGRRDKRQASHIGCSEIEKRLHAVRGHFKARKGGIFWWRPFLRGNADLGIVAREGYQVLGVPQKIGEDA